MNTSQKSLLSSLAYEPQVLKFGTSGRRGELIHLTQLEIYINATAELRYLQSLSSADGGVQRGDDFYFAYDLRPSSVAFAKEFGGRGELAQAIEKAVLDAGMKPVNLGAIPTPALTFFALTQGKGSIMVTGSHIPFDRNGYKLNTSKGELLKVHEAPIGKAVESVRAEFYDQPSDLSLFNEQGMLKSGHMELVPSLSDGLELYRKRYLSFFPEGILTGKRYVVYQHSAVGRDFLVSVLQALGADAVPAGRSDTFVPIDTENIDDERLQVLQTLADQTAKQAGPLDGVVSTDGDSDRPLVLGVEPDGKLRFFGGDLLGMIVAGHLHADAVVVPISTNDAIDRGSLKDALQPKTKIGSPFVIAGMELAVAQGHKVVCGWEANGGFLLGSDIQQDGRVLKKLATRDAMLPILATLSESIAAGVALPVLLDRLPKRYSKAALLKDFPRPVSEAILQKFGADKPDAKEQIAEYFTGALGFAPVASMDYTDGVRITFQNGEVAHMRPSGNADEFRVYAVADTQHRADEIAKEGTAEPNGILRTLERSVKH